MNRDVAVIDQAPAQLPARAANPMDVAPAEFTSALARRGANRRALLEWVRSALVDKIDYGAIPTSRGPSKPSLRKPGAEKICGMLGVTATFPTLEQYERSAIEGRPISQIILRCHLLSADGQVVADGVGARSLEQDRGDLNKALKMAVKSAHIDATLRMAGLSEIFTQDLEDMPREALDGDERVPHEHRQPSAPSNGGGYASDKQVSLIRFRLKDADIAEQSLLDQFQLTELAKTPKAKVNEILAWIAG